MRQLTTPPPGVELIRAIFEGRLPPPGVATLLGMEGVSADEGHVVFALEPTAEHTNPIGTIHGGILATLLDSAMTSAVYTVIPAGTFATTVELSVRYVKAAQPGGQRLVADGTVVHAGKRLATAEGRLTGADGTLYATATTTCMILEEPR